VDKELVRDKQVYNVLVVVGLMGARGDMDRPITHSTNLNVSNSPLNLIFMSKRLDMRGLEVLVE
jgi:hypothetical protein